jgi:hypothetical protein
MGDQNNPAYISHLGGSFYTDQWGNAVPYAYNTYTQALALKNLFYSSLKQQGYDSLSQTTDLDSWAANFNRTNRNIEQINLNKIPVYGTAERTTFSYKVEVQMPFYMISVCWMIFSIVTVGVSFWLYYRKDIK